MAQSSLSEDLASKLKPGAIASVRDVINSRLPLRQDLFERLGQIHGIGRRANLVVHNAQRISLLGPLQDGANEILAPGAK